jgi:hypothetical protein
MGIATCADGRSVSYCTAGIECRPRTSDPQAFTQSVMMDAFSKSWR